MGQYWQVVSQNKEGKSALWEQLIVWGKLGEILPGGFAGRQLQQQLMIPSFKLFGGGCTKNAGIKQKLCALSAKIQAELPPEEGILFTTDEKTLNEIISNIHYLLKYGISEVCLGDYFDARDIPSLMEVLFDEFLGGWVDQRIVCVGGYSNKLPPGIQHESNSLYNDGYPVTLVLSDVVDVFLGSFRSQSPSKAQIFEEEYARLFEESFPASQTYVLLNLTCRKYVCGDGLWGRTLKQSTNNEAPGLGDAAMTHICWSQDSSTSLQYDWMDVEGKWAGHRFMIIPKTVFDIISDKKGWRDVTGEVFGLLNELWESEELIS